MWGLNAKREEEISDLRNDDGRAMRKEQVIWDDAEARAFRRLVVYVSACRGGGDG